jgi:hypothetical protein
LRCEFARFEQQQREVAERNADPYDTDEESEVSEESQNCESEELAEQDEQEIDQQDEDELIQVVDAINLEEQSEPVNQRSSGLSAANIPNKKAFNNRAKDAWNFLIDRIVAKDMREFMSEAPGSKLSRCIKSCFKISDQQKGFLKGGAFAAAVACFIL